MRLGELMVAVKCQNCGVHGDGKPLYGTRNRCNKCGQYAQSAENYCSTHGVDVSELRGYDYCPMCQEERDIQAQYEHTVTRDPMVEPW